MQLMPLDLPAPVAPAISRCGVVARSRNTALPAMSLPMATSSGPVAWRGLRRDEQVAEGDELAGVVGHLDADRRAAGDRGQDAHVGGRHGVGDVALQAGDPGDLDAGAELELVAGDGRADGHADDRGVDAVRGQRLLEHPAARLDLGPVDRLGPGAGEVRAGRQRPRRRSSTPAPAPGRRAPAGWRPRRAARRRAVVEVVGGVVRRSGAAAPAARPGAIVASTDVVGDRRARCSATTGRAAPGGRRGPSGGPALPTPCPVRVAIVRSDVWVISRAPPMPAPRRMTTAPTGDSSACSGVPTIAPSRPPER